VNRLELAPSASDGFGAPRRRLAMPAQDAALGRSRMFPTRSARRSSANIRRNRMKAYVIVTGILFGLVTLAHLWRMYEEPRLVTNPSFLSITILTAALSLVAWRVARRR
jgi:hypothetical protein